MSSLIVPRRRFLQGLAALAVCAPAIVRAPSLMAVSARFCGSPSSVPAWAPQDALPFLQYEMERRFAETLFGADGRSAEAENTVPAWSRLAAEAKTTALWTLRTGFGPRGAPPKPFEALPAEVQAGLCSMFGASCDMSPEPWAARLSNSAARTRVSRSI